MREDASDMYKLLLTTGDPVVQERAIKLFLKNRDESLGLAILGSPGLPEQAEDQILDNSPVGLLSAWLSNPDIDVDKVRRRTLSETRVRVLSAVAPRDDLGRDVYEKLVTASRSDLVMALVASNPAVDLDLREKAALKGILALLSSSKTDWTKAARMSEMLATLPAASACHIAEQLLSRAPAPASPLFGAAATILSAFYEEQTASSSNAALGKVAFGFGELLQSYGDLTQVMHRRSPFQSYVSLMEACAAVTMAAAQAGTTDIGVVAGVQGELARLVAKLPPYQQHSPVVSKTSTLLQVAESFCSDQFVIESATADDLMLLVESRSDHLPTLLSVLRHDQVTDEVMHAAVNAVMRVSTDLDQALYQMAFRAAEAGEFSRAATIMSQFAVLRSNSFSTAGPHRHTTWKPFANPVTVFVDALNVEMRRPMVDALAAEFKHRGFPFETLLAASDVSPFVVMNVKTSSLRSADIPQAVLADVVGLLAGTLGDTESAWEVFEVLVNDGDLSLEEASSTAAAL